MASTALITGVAGQDGSYLTELLLDAGYRVHGIDSDRAALDRLQELVRTREDAANLTLYPIDVTDAPAVHELVSAVRPDEVYNLAAQSRVDRSFADPDTTFRGIVVGTANVLEAIRGHAPECRVFQASSCEMFGDAPAPQHEDTEFRPVSPYASAKFLAHRWATTYRESYGLFVCAGIMFNHESRRRSADFVTRHITRGVAQILAGQRQTLPLGNVDSRRDWGHAIDYVRAMHLMLQRPEPTDYVVATGESHSVAEFADRAFARADLHWRDYVSHDPSRLRRKDPGEYRGDASRLQQTGWKAETSLDDTIEEMLAEDRRVYKVD